MCTVSSLTAVYHVSNVNILYMCVSLQNVGVELRIIIYNIIFPSANICRIAPGSKNYYTYL